jgi:phosphinothricin acetyltransferase
MERNAESFGIRTSLDRDIEAIAQIYAHHVAHGTASFEIEPPSPEEMWRRRSGILDLGLPHLVAELRSQVLGYAYAGPYRPRAAYWNTVEDSVYVRPDALRQGVGRLLLKELIERCTALGLRQMIAVVGDSASLASIRLHESLGFRRVGLLHSVGYKHGRWLDSVLLQRALGDSDLTAPARGAPP